MSLKAAQFFVSYGIHQHLVCRQGEKRLRPLKRSGLRLTPFAAVHNLNNSRIIFTTSDTPIWSRRPNAGGESAIASSRDAMFASRTNIGTSVKKGIDAHFREGVALSRGANRDGGRLRACRRD
jgi:hypothetical protein